MTLDELSAFVRVAQQGSVSGAARSLALPKSTVSRLISSLEEGLAVRLLQRTTRGSILTEEGRIFIGHAHRVLAELDEARLSVLAGVSEARGLLRVSAPQTLGVRFLSPVLPSFLIQYPNVRVALQLTSRKVDLAEEGFDLAIRIGEPRSSSLMMRRLTSIPILLCASPRYLDKRDPIDEPGALTTHDMLLRARSPGGVDLEFSFRNQETRTHLNPRLSSNDPALLVEAALAGIGIAEAPLVLVQDYLRSGQLVEVLPTYRLPETAIFALFHPGTGMALRVRVFLDFLAASLVPTLLDE